MWECLSQGMSGEVAGELENLSYVQRKRIGGGRE